MHVAFRDSASAPIFWLLAVAFPACVRPLPRRVTSRPSSPALRAAARKGSGSECRAGAAWADRRVVRRPTGRVRRLSCSLRSGTPGLRWCLARARRFRGNSGRTAGSSAHRWSHCRTTTAGRIRPGHCCAAARWTPLWPCCRARDAGARRHRHRLHVLNRHRLPRGLCLAGCNAPRCVRASNCMRRTAT